MDTELQQLLVDGRLDAVKQQLQGLQKLQEQQQLLVDGTKQRLQKEEQLFLDATRQQMERWHQQLQKQEQQWQQQLQQQERQWQQQLQKQEQLLWEQVAAMGEVLGHQQAAWTSAVYQQRDVTVRLHELLVVLQIWEVQQRQLHEMQQQQLQQQQQQLQQQLVQLQQDLQQLQSNSSSSDSNNVQASVWLQSLQQCLLQQQQLIAVVPQMQVHAPRVNRVHLADPIVDRSDEQERASQAPS